MDLGVTRTIRLEDDLDELLQRIAKDEKVTVNSIVTRSLRRYADWDRHAERFGMMAVRPAMLVELMERHTLDEARQLGRLSAKDSMRPAVEYIFVDFTLPNVVEFLRRFSKYGGRYQFEDSPEGRKHVILMRYALGMKWSAYYEGMLKCIFEDEVGIKIKVSASPEVVIGKFELSG
jgi:hypothetical protein